ncbi:MAG TPA: histidine kinase dimerization/phospho-acceptor domain-containing protein [Myxococcota bacterium]|nr:histidine kinase dimerization/phospho-acceptor domain-containing protein [Myxococcota bacterium]
MPTTVWIVHREDRARAALVRLAGISDAVIGRPSDPIFDAAPAADVVVLGLAGDWEAELEFAHRQRSRLGHAHWVLIGEKGEADAAFSQFDQLSVDFLAYPPRADDLARVVRPAGSQRPPLSQRARREVAASRFSRWLADLDLPELLRALDPRLAGVSVLVRGEPGTGRGTLVRYLHHFGGTADGALAHVACTADTGLHEIESALFALGRAHPRIASQSVWLEDVSALLPRVQRELAIWLEAGPPPGVRATTLRWLATVDANGPALDPQLARALGTIEIRLPPLRERTHRIEAIALDVASAWARTHRETPRHFDADAMAFLCEYPWPGNLRELEAVVEQSLASTARDPLGIDDLVLEGFALAPIDASIVGTLLPDGAEDAPVEPAEAVEAADSPLPQPIVGAAFGEPRPDGESPRGPDSQRIRDDDPGLRRLANALIHQVRNPLATIRTFAELLPERFDDPDFRARFPEMVREDVGRIHGLLARLEQLTSLAAPRRDKVDVSGMIAELLEERREVFRSRHHLVLKELDSSRPAALADAGQLRLAFEALFDKAIAIVPERGDIYVASRRHEGSGSNGPGIRVLLRFSDPSAGGSDSLGPLQNSIELLIAELIVRAQGGRLTLGASEAEERVLVVDLPAP